MRWRPWCGAAGAESDGAGVDHRISDVAEAAVSELEVDA